MSKLSDYLNEIAAKRGLDSSRKFADAAGIGKSTAAELLGGHRPPRAETLQSIADNLGLPLSRMRELAGMPEEDVPFVLPPESSKLNARQRRLVVNLVRELVDVRRE